MLIHAAGNPELGESAVVVVVSFPSSLSLFLSLFLSNPITEWIISYYGSLCSLSDTFPVYSQAAIGPILTHCSLTTGQADEPENPWALTVDIHEKSI